MRTDLVSIPTPTHPLDGAYYTPDGMIKGAAMYCHGNQMNFYVCAARFLAPYVTALGYSFLAFNRRGHDSVSTYDSREPVGGAYQTVAEGIEDNELAARFLAEKGFQKPIVIGHSNGGVLASEHVANHPETKALILLSAHAGGNRMKNPRAARNYSLAGNTEELKQQAETLIAAGKPNQLMLIPDWWWVISARTYLDRLTNARIWSKTPRRSHAQCSSSAAIKNLWITTPLRDLRKTAAARAKSSSYLTAITSTLARRNR
jgi:pimeloyl-ACP methyl ester carboxylesterase